MIQRKKKKKIKDKKEYARFVETAERIQKENGGKAFEEAIQKIAKVKGKNKNSPRD
jgi:hypothetical protein